MGDGRRRRYVVRGLIAFEVVALTALAGYGILTNVTAARTSRRSSRHRGRPPRPRRHRR